MGSSIIPTLPGFPPGEQSSDSATRKRVPATQAYDEMTFEFAAAQAVSKEALKAHVALYGGYVMHTNQLLEALRALLTGGPPPDASCRRESLSRRLAFELNGLVLHEHLFEQMEEPTSAEGPRSDSCATQAMDHAYGGFESWRADIKLLAQTRGVGWVATFWDPDADYLINGWIDLHHLNVPAGQRLVFVLDLWEHAYGGDFGAAQRAAYVDATLAHTNWRVVERRCQPLPIGTAPAGPK